MYLARLASLPENMVKSFSFATEIPEIQTECFGRIGSALSLENFYGKYKHEHELHSHFNTQYTSCLGSK